MKVKFLVGQYHRDSVRKGAVKEIDDEYAKALIKANICIEITEEKKKKGKLPIIETR